MRRESGTSGVPPGCLAGVVLTGLLFLVPLFFARAMMTALGRLGLPPRMAVAALAGMVAITALTVWVCYRAAEPRPGVGIMLPALLA